MPNGTAAHWNLDTILTYFTMQLSMLVEVSVQQVSANLVTTTEKLPTQMPKKCLVGCAGPVMAGMGQPYKP